MTHDVSRETSAMLDQYEALLRHWTKKINLISKGDLADLNTRHIVDSLQVAEAAPDAKNWLDIGSGGGLPGIPVAIARRTDAFQMTMIEADQRKGVFLRTVARELGLKIEVRSERIETCAPIRPDVISARALAPLPKLLELSSRHSTPSTVFMFQKGSQWRQEVDSALENWHFDFDVVPSTTQEGAALLRLSNVRLL